jgi:hypothetical protein
VNAQNTDADQHILCRSQYLRKDKPYIAVYAQLTISLIFSLSLHKPPGGDSIMLCFKPYHVNKSATAERTMEERRAVLACFHITSQYDNLSSCEYLSQSPDLILMQGVVYDGEDGRAALDALHGPVP